MITPEQEADIERRLYAHAQTMPPVNLSDGHQAYNMASGFHMAALRSAEPRPLPDGRIESPMVAVVVNLAFASELYLKALLLEQNMKAHGHELKKLYKLLPTTDKALIARHYNELTGLDESKLNGTIVQYSNLFVDWRYLYEKNTRKGVLPYKLSNIVLAMFRAACEKHPHWADDNTTRTLETPIDRSTISMLSLGGGNMVRFILK